MNTTLKKKIDIIIILSNISILPPTIPFPLLDRNDCFILTTLYVPTQGDTNNKLSLEGKIYLSSILKDTPSWIEFLTSLTKESQTYTRANKQALKIIKNASTLLSILSENMLSKDNQMEPNGWKKEIENQLTNTYQYISMNANIYYPNTKLIPILKKMVQNTSDTIYYIFISEENQVITEKELIQDMIKVLAEEVEKKTETK